MRLVHYNANCLWIVRELLNYLAADVAAVVIGAKHCNKQVTIIQFLK